MQYTPAISELIRYGNRTMKKYAVELNDLTVAVVEGFWKQMLRNGVMGCSSDVKSFFYECYLDVLENYVDGAINSNTMAGDYAEGLEVFAERIIGTDMTSLIEDIAFMKVRRLPIGEHLHELTKDLDPEDYGLWHSALVEAFVKAMPCEDDFQSMAAAIYSDIDDVKIIDLQLIDHIHYEFADRLMYVYVDNDDDGDDSLTSEQLKDIQHRYDQRLEVLQRRLWKPLATKVHKERGLRPSLFFLSLLALGDLFELLRGIGQGSAHHHYLTLYNCVELDPQGGTTYDGSHVFGDSSAYFWEVLIAVSQSSELLDTVNQSQYGFLHLLRARDTRQHFECLHALVDVGHICNAGVGYFELDLVTATIFVKATGQFQTERVNTLIQHRAINFTRGTTAYHGRVVDIGTEEVIDWLDDLTFNFVSTYNKFV